MALRCSVAPGPLDGSCRRASVLVHAGQAKRPNRPTGQPSSGGGRGGSRFQQGRGYSAPGQRGSTLPLPEVTQVLQRIWRSMKATQLVKKDSSGLCLAPESPGTLGKRVQLYTNHFTIDILSEFQNASRYRITITPKIDTTSAVQSSKKVSASTTAASSPAVPLDVRSQVIKALAQQQSWDNNGWLFDPSAMMLMSLSKLAVREVDVQLPGSGGQSKSLQVTLAPTSGPADDNSTLQQLLLVLKASLIAALAPRNAVTTPGSFLFPPSASQAAAAAPGSPATSRGAGGQGTGRSGGRGGGSYSTMGPLQLWDGLRAGMKQGDLFSIQLDATKAAVLPAGPLAQLLVWPGSGASSPADLCRDKRLLAAAEAAVLGAKVRVEHVPQQARNVWGLDARTPEQFKFKFNGKDTTVAQYFRSQYPDLKLRHLKDWPCVYTNKAKTAAVPLELCRIEKPQPRRNLTATQTADLIRQAALPPERRLATIKQLAGQVLVGAQAALMQTWGVKVRGLLKVPGRVLPDAKLQYARDQCADANNTGQWRPPPSMTLLQPPRLMNWAVVNLASPSTSQADVMQFVERLTQQLRSQGGSATTPAIVDGNRCDGVQEAVAAAAAKAGASPQLLLVVLPSKNDSKMYNAAKAAAAAAQIPSQCMVASAAGIGRDIKDQYVGNLLLKITAKAGGIGWQLPQGPEVWTPPLAGQGGLMVFGVDVGHGFAGGSSSKPSVAGVVGTLDSSCSRYGAVVLEQTAGHEIVLGLREAAVQLLGDRKTGSGMLPGSLMVYRDGVSDSQYLAVLQQEVPALRQACMDVGGNGYKPKITLVVVSKSHGTRLFPSDPSDAESSDGRTGNVKPGTVVDTIITAPLRYEYFLCSHAGIQGTNRCARYNVLVDDNNLGPDALQLITQHLASTYCSCTRTISTPAAVRYADKAAGASWAAAAAGPWTTVQQGSTGVKELEYRTLSISQQMAGKMWFV